jgi:hypothetical protein
MKTDRLFIDRALHCVLAVLFQHAIDHVLLDILQVACSYVWRKAKSAGTPPLVTPPCYRKATWGFAQTLLRQGIMSTWCLPLSAPFQAANFGGFDSH